MSIIVRVNGEPFEYFKQINLSKSLDDICGHGQLVVSKPMDDLSILKINDLVQIFIVDDKTKTQFQVLGGYQEGVEDNEAEGSHNISFSIRDTVQDLIDSTVPQAVRKMQSYTDFVQILNAVINGLGMSGYIGVNNQRGPLPLPYDSSGIPMVKQAEMGTGAGQYISECARIVSCIMNTSYSLSGQTQLLLRNFTNENQLKTMLLFQTGGTNNNVLESSLSIDYSERYGKVKIWSNGNVTYYQQNPYTGLAGYSGTANDTEARQERLLEIFAQAPLADSAHCAMRAAEEVNLRRARSWKYTCKVSGFTANGQLWDIGQLVRVQDDHRRVKGWFLIKDVEYSYTLDGGAITTMTLTYPDAYGVTITNYPVNANLNNPMANSMGVTYSNVPSSQKWKNGGKINMSTSQGTGKH